jgi:hypothetical protein
MTPLLQYVQVLLQCMLSIVWKVEEMNSAGIAQLGPMNCSEGNVHVVEEPEVDCVPPPIW